MKNSSLTVRIIVLSLFWILMALLATAQLLGQFYRDHIEEHYDAHVFTHVEELVAAMETTAGGEHRLSRVPTDPRFHLANSGWYWSVLENGEPLRQSASLGDRRLDLSAISVDESHGVQMVRGPAGEELRAQVIHIAQPQDHGSLTFVATAPEMRITDDVHAYFKHILISFLLLGILLSFAVVMQVYVALKPLKAIRASITDIRAGNMQRLPQDFPRDVQPVADELNFLLDHNEMLLKRARNQLADLAHAAKNPLAIIRNEARKLSSKEGQLILDQSHVMASSIDHCLSRASIFGKKDAIGYRTSVKSVIEDLRFAVSHLYQDRGVEIRLLCVEDRWFRGEAQDLEEMAGNLLDNACKWANSVVTVNCSASNNHFVLTIEDDGPGIPAEELATVTRRGRKLDVSREGHGHGLGIVKDIAELYGGSLTLGRSELGGLRADLSLPSA